MASTCLSGLADYINLYGKQSYRKLARQLGVSKSSVGRRQQIIDKRSDILASEFFETQEGQRFTTRLIVACIFVFGITSGVGANRISHFMSLVQLDQFMAVSASSISRTEDQIDDLIIQFKEKYGLFASLRGIVNLADYSSKLQQMKMKTPHEQYQHR